QQIIAHESGAANSVDPLGGSYLVEALTDQIEAQARAYFQRIADLGGVIPAIERGFFQQEISDAAYQYQREIDAGTRTIVGVNDFVDDQPIQIPILAMDPQGQTRQLARLAALRRERDSGRVGQALDRLRIACQGTENTMPHILAAVRAYATLGEIVDVMKAVFGVYAEPVMV
ncbi:MAG: methylmalonyl-CoA mutase, partial [Anaerolineales bacterium]|nr:methylmalonyl-CoA mutase [Anaerolineales bacterium]